MSKLSHHSNGFGGKAEAKFLCTLEAGGPGLCEDRLENQTGNGGALAKSWILWVTG